MISKDLRSFIKKNIIDKKINCSYLETGFLEGESAEEMLQLGFKKVVSIEIDRNHIEQGKSKFSKYIYDKKLELVHGDSSEKLSDYYSDKFDVIFLDAHNTYDQNLIEKSAPLEKEMNIIIERGLESHQILIIDDYLKIKYSYLFNFKGFDWRFLIGNKFADLVKKLDKKTYEIPYKGNSHLLILGNNLKYNERYFKNLFFRIYNLNFLIKYNYLLLVRIVKFFLKKIIFR